MTRICRRQTGIRFVDVLEIAWLSVEGNALFLVARHPLFVDDDAHTVLSDDFREMIAVEDPKAPNPTIATVSIFIFSRLFPSDECLMLHRSFCLFVFAQLFDQIRRICLELNAIVQLASAFQRALDHLAVVMDGRFGGCGQM